MLDLNILNIFNIQGYSIKKNVHSYRQGDLFIAHDVNSGSLHLLDEGTFDVIKACEELQEADKEITHQGISDVLSQAGKNVTEEPSPGYPCYTEIFTELDELRREGTLFSAEAPEVPPLYPEKPIVKAICLHVAHDCNLRCKYCFAGTGPFGGDRTLMSLETGKKGIDFVLELSGHRKQCEVDFFGGEPLLNFKMVKDLIEYGKKAAANRNKTIKFTLTTNAVLLNEKVQKFLEQEEISVVLSLDGRPEVHDRMRPYADGRGSYAKVTPLITQFAAKRPESSPFAVGNYYYVRGTYTHFNLDFDRDVLHIADLGINRISMEPVVAGPEDAYAFQAEDLTKIRESYDRLGEEILVRRTQDKSFSFFHFNVALDQGPCLLKRLSGCGAGHEYVAISPEGVLYPCHQFVGQDKYKLGSLYNENPYQLKAELVQAFRSANIYAKSSCRECWARFACSGGCHAANVAFTQKLTEVYKMGCELQKKRLEAAFYVKIKEILQDSYAVHVPEIRC